MLLTIDIGNTTTSLGLFEETANKDNTYNLLHRWDISTSLNNTPDEYGSTISNLIGINGYTVEHIKSTSICSVVPSITSTFTKMSEFYFNCSPLVIGTGIKTGININAPIPFYQGPILFSYGGGPGSALGIGQTQIKFATLNDGITPYRTGTNSRRFQQDEPGYFGQMDPTLKYKLIC